MDGQPVRIISQNEETKTFELDEEALESILLSPEVADKHVCLLAVAGAFRMGKSFLLDFFLRYCASTAGSAGSEDWLADTSSPLTGFRWSNGHERVTCGILLWSKPFIMRSATGEQVAVLLMDTQGTFDKNSSLKDSTMLFALTLMVSSVMVYNLMRNIGEDDLMHLQSFTSYGVQAQEELNNSTTFQKLIFLVRDWGFPSSKPYGNAGGQDALDSALEMKEELHPAHQDVRRDLRKCFRELGCYLMPHPGLRFLEDENFDGRVDCLEENFVQHLQILVPRLLAPENLVKKEFDGQVIKAKDLLVIFRTCMEVFRDIDMPEPTTYVEITTRITNERVMMQAIDVYESTMDTLIRDELPRVFKKLEAEHEEIKRRVITFFVVKNQRGGKNRRVVEEYQAQLEQKVDHRFRSHFAPLASSEVARKAGLEHYKTAMEKQMQSETLGPYDFENKHRKHMEEANDVYRKCNTYGHVNPKISQSSAELLEQAMVRLFKNYAEKNKKKYAVQMRNEQILQGLAAAAAVTGAFVLRFITK